MPRHRDDPLRVRRRSPRRDDRVHRQAAELRHGQGCERTAVRHPAGVRDEPDRSEKARRLRLTRRRLEVPCELDGPARPHRVEVDERAVLVEDDEIDPREVAMRETEDAIQAVLSSSEAVELSPQNAYIRRLQHQLAERANLVSRSRGREPYRRVRLYPDAARSGWR